ncbi:hypothetical protein BGZ76_001659 [Entomortierella beljakovae]|nr:hypothetical protein BGZ76_001659 [Entomortierella beljakovae]
MLMKRLKRVRAYFPNENATAEGLIHILVELPQQEVDDEEVKVDDEKVEVVEVVDDEEEDVAYGDDDSDDREKVREGKNQIEYYLDGMFGEGHRADIVDGKFAVTKLDPSSGKRKSDPGFRIVYICGTDLELNHKKIVKIWLM